MTWLVLHLPRWAKPTDRRRTSVALLITVVRVVLAEFVSRVVTIVFRALSRTGSEMPRTCLIVCMTRCRAMRVTLRVMMVVILLLSLVAIISFVPRLMKLLGVVKVPTRGDCMRKKAQLRLGWLDRVVSWKLIALT